MVTDQYMCFNFLYFTLTRTQLMPVFEGAKRNKRLGRSMRRFDVEFFQRNGMVRARYGHGMARYGLPEMMAGFDPHACIEHNMVAFARSISSPAEETEQVALARLLVPSAGDEMLHEMVKVVRCIHRRLPKRVSLWRRWRPDRCRMPPRLFLEMMKHTLGLRIEPLLLCGIMLDWGRIPSDKCESCLVRWCRENSDAMPTVDARVRAAVVAKTPLHLVRPS
jgi:hypothetical protein